MYNCVDKNYTTSLTYKIFKINNTYILQHPEDFEIAFNLWLP